MDANQTQDPAAPRGQVDILAPFSLSGSRAACLAEGALHLLSRAGFAVTTPSVTRILHDGPASDVPALRILCLRMVEQGDAGLLARVRHFARWATAGRALVVVRDRSLWRSATQLLCLMLIILRSLRPGFRLRTAHARLGARRAVKYLTGLRLERVDAGSARRAVFDHLGRHHPDRLRLSPALVRGALRANGGAPLTAELSRLSRLAAEFDAGALQRHRLRAWANAPELAPQHIARALASPHLTAKVGTGARADAIASLMLHPTPRNAQPTWTSPQAHAFAGWFTGSAPLPQDLQGPVGDAAEAMQRWQWLLCLIFRPRVTLWSDLNAPWQSAALADFADTMVGSGPQGTGLSITGDARSRTGIGQNHRMIQSALRGGEVAPGQTLTAPVTLHAMNADRIAPQLLSAPWSFPGYQIGHLLWEFQGIPQAHRLAIDLLDEIWTPSTFVAESYRAVTDKPVIRMGKGIRLPRQVHPSLAPDGVFRFLVAYDAHSSVERKNPLAAIRAFEAGFQERCDIEMVIKSTPLPRSHWGDPMDQTGALRRIAAVDPRITLIEEHLPFRDLLGLIAGADALISPHRAEGFGYFPAYALALGTAVIATDYSGTQDFCSPQSAFPVPCRMVDVPGGFASLPRAGARWAEIDADALIETMRQVVDGQTDARARTLTGQRMINTRYAPAKLSQRYVTRLSQLGLLTRKRKTLDQMFP